VVGIVLQGRGLVSFSASFKTSSGTVLLYVGGVQLQLSSSSSSSSTSTGIVLAVVGVVLLAVVGGVLLAVVLLPIILVLALAVISLIFELILSRLSVGKPDCEQYG
jgi:hypothetical protein